MSHINEKRLKFGKAKAENIMNEKNHKSWFQIHPKDRKQSKRKQQSNNQSSDSKRDHGLSKINDRSKHCKCST